MKKVTYYFGKHSPLTNFHHCIYFFDKNHVRYTSSEKNGGGKSVYIAFSHVSLVVEEDTVV